MEKQRKRKQRMLQVSFGLCLIFFVFLIELLAIHPSGIYSYSQQGFKEFKIGFSKAAVLKKINHRKTIRAIRVCEPDQVFELKSRHRFILTEELVSSDFWICHDRTGKEFVFVFREDVLERIFLQRLRFGKKQGSMLFSRCNPDIIQDIDAYLSTRETLTVFYDGEEGKKK